MKRIAWLMLTFFLIFCAAGGRAQENQISRVTPRPLPRKDVLVQIPTGFRADVISVKFKDGLDLKVIGEELKGSDIAVQKGLPALLGRLAKGKWRPAHSVSRERLRGLRRNGETRAGKALPDLSVQFHLVVPPGRKAVEVINALNALDCVELAQPIPKPVPPPDFPPDYSDLQQYQIAAPDGIDARYAWNPWAIFGNGIQIVDIEYDFNASHEDLPPITILPGGQALTEFTDHGTAALGVMAMLNNGWGGTGSAWDASFFFAYAIDSDGVWNVGDAITRSLVVLQPGDIILIEQQMAGPNYVGNGQQGLVPVEWYKPSYDAIITAVSQGVIVVVAAGNGSEDLDGAVYSTDNNGHYPFTSAQDSGSIIVGAGAPNSSMGGSEVLNSRLDFSNYGSTLDLHGWGQSVMTTGYGYLYEDPAFGDNRDFTKFFNGTSSASPHVTGAVALLQSAYKTRTGGQALMPTTMKETLQSTGTPQASGTYPASERIGPMPDLWRAFALFWPIAAAPPAIVTAENAFPPNGTPDPGETLQVDLPLINLGTTNTTNLVATLKPTGGVNNPSGPQSYGVLQAQGPSLARPFTFTASGNCGDDITLTLALEDGATDLGTVTFSMQLGTSTQTFSNATPILIPAGQPGTTDGVSTPYPSNITVSGVIHPVTKVTVKLINISHTYPHDVDVLLVGPRGQTFILMSDVIGGTDWTGQTYTFDDDAGTVLPEFGTPPATGTYTPVNYGTDDIFDAPAPAAPYLSPGPAGAHTLTSTFANLDPNGTWSLYVVDDAGVDIGTFNGGWEISVTTRCSLPVSIVSRKLHGGATTSYDVTLPLVGAPGIECRSGGTNNLYQIVVSFLNAVTFSDADVTSGTGSVTSASGSGTKTAIVNLTGVSSGQTIEITLSDVNDGASISDLVVPMSILVADTTGNGSVNASDVSQTKSRSGQVLSTSNFRSDVNLNGSINSSDISLVKSKSGTALPP